ncbi:RNA polymerase sigma factor [Sinanaerobacter sp. ZZT-01]|uniref:RNA polymerase sigma factor n=1 Tax=Sinanaerobacter sp. ZZT-01 TaxID=3111540 RepID=UPI002D767ABD|nr:RNA polymerase sigma factor [Sinanaerobacter sp. ZZT-01]WRR93399.1 RNA polymerase sigma factor [Sinanaerobacter sp. ZZT-01]
MTCINISCEAVIEQYADLVYRIAISHVTNKQDAEDIFQDVFVSLIKNISRIEDEMHLKHWLIRATINRTKNYHSCFWKRHVNFNLVVNTEETTYLQEENSQIDEIREQISTLPIKLKSVVYLHYYEGYSVDEIAVILKVPSGTVKSRLYNARKILKNKLREVNGL